MSYEQDVMIRHLEENEEEVFLFPASFSQRRLWFLEQFTPGNTMFNVASGVRLQGPFDFAALEQCFVELVSRHESLRTTFDQVDGDVMQVVHQPLFAGITRFDIEASSEEEAETQLWELVEAQAQRPFDLVNGPLMRVTLVKKNEHDHVLSMVLHHIITDGWSMGLFFYELMTLYAAFSQGQEPQLPELALQYADYALWQDEWLQGEELDKQLGYWLKQLGGKLPVLQLPTDFPRPAVQSYRGDEKFAMLPKVLLERLTAWSQQEGVTLFMTLLAAFQTLLHRYTGQTDLLVGTPIANRNHADIEAIIGFFVNTLVMRTDLTGDPTFAELVGRVRDVALGAYAHQEMPFDKLIEELQPERETSHSPVYQVMFALQNMPLELEVQLPDVKMTRIQVANAGSQHDLMLLLTETAEGLKAHLQYSTDLFTEATIERMITHFQTLLEDIVAHPQKRLSELAILPEAERRKVLVEWNDGGSVAAQEKSIAQWFETQAARTPEAIALVSGDTRLTYEELNRRANQMAHFLQRKGVTAGSFVGLAMERSPELIISLLGILKAGAVYVPLDPNYPQERLRFMLADTKLSVLIAHQHLLEHLPADGVQVIRIEQDAAAIALENETNPLQTTDPNSLAYVMYTSGSTGVPKGVLIPQRGVTRLVKGQDFIQLDADEVLLQFAPVSFDASTLEIWGALLNGARLVLFPAHKASLEELGRVLHEQKVTTLWLTAALFHQMVESHWEALRPLRQLIAGGDVLSVPHVQKVRELLPHVRLVNGYGPTENTTFTTCYPLPEQLPVGASIPIGRPIRQTQVYLLDEKQQPVPVGIPGELYIGGAGLARGYLNRPDLTAEKFVPHPFSADPQARLYKTGDLARYLPDGNLEFLGRIDNQVKIRGFRIELGEIETALVQHPAIREAVVIAREDVPGDKRLVAYLAAESIEEQQTLEEPTPDTLPNTAALRRLLGQSLPDYMIPSAFVILPELPVTPNGKVDRRALPAPDATDLQSGTAYVAPRNPVEEQLAQICGELLNVERVGVYDNFFDLGGHSLLATQLITRVTTHFGVELALRSLFQDPTIARLAENIAEAQAKQQQEAAEAKPALKALARDSYRVRK